MDIVLLGGALGSLFSVLQFIASPVIGKLSDILGRRRVLLISMVTLRLYIVLDFSFSFPAFEMRCALDVFDLCFFWLSFVVL